MKLCQTYLDSDDHLEDVDQKLELWHDNEVRVFFISDLDDDDMGMFSV